MKKLLKIVGYSILVILLLVIGLVSYVKLALPNVGAAEVMKVNNSAELIERGRYLANSVTVCIDCHSTRDWTKFSGPIVEGTCGKGGETFDQKFGFPGVYYSKNITPAGIARYTDGELYRVITTGVTKEGKALFPVMPYTYYGNMDPDDIQCIIAYLRSLSPIENQVPESVSDFPMSIIINAIPKKVVPGKKPDTANHLAYGAYLVNACGCRECHTKDNKGQIIPEMAFMGGREFPLRDGSIIRSSNLTPDPATGLGNWNEDAFISKFKSYTDSSYKPHTVASGAMNTIMPWTMYGKMTRSDLAAIFTYFKSLPPKENKVEKFTAAGIAKK